MAKKNRASKSSDLVRYPVHYQPARWRRLQAPVSRPYVPVCSCAAATNRNFKTGEYPLFYMTRRTLRRQPRPAIRGRSETAIHKHATDSNAPGRGHGCIQPFLWCPETAVTHATSYLCGAMWCGVGALRERRRAITALGRHIESNESNQRIRSARTAVPTCQTVYLQHIQIYQCFTTLLCSCS